MSNDDGLKFLMDAALALPKPDNLSTAEASTVGVGFYTACLGVFGGLNIPIPEDAKSLPPATGEWVLVLGGSSSVGKFAVQLLKALGYKVAVTCSPGSAEVRQPLDSFVKRGHHLQSASCSSRSVRQRQSTTRNRKRSRSSFFRRQPMGS
jgi:hypothetical protein